MTAVCARNQQADGADPDVSPGPHRTAAIAVTAAALWAAAIPAQHVTVPRNIRRPGPRAADRRLMRDAFRRNPRSAGAPWPTSDRAARRMLDLAGVDWQAVRVAAELGAGTGTFTRQILDRLWPGACLHVYEQDAALAAVLAGRFAGDLRVRLHGDAVSLHADLGDGGYADLIVSELPWAWMGREARRGLLWLAGRCLTPGTGVLVAAQPGPRQERAFRQAFGEVRREHAPGGWPVLYRLARPRTAPLLTAVRTGAAVPPRAAPAAGP